ncbi:MAG: lysophospholipid acyltransferase family protein [Desulfovibrionales bacterium]|nr:lysophospholipid acyltransferase family protein [Desulfovibrionales bacterium]
MRDLLYNALVPWGASLSLQRLHSLGTVLGKLMWTALPARRKETIQTISERLHISPHAATALAKASFCHSAQSFLEIFHSRHVDCRFLHEHAEFDSPELVQAVQTTMRPVVATTAHFGCWELLTGLMGLFNSAQECLAVVRLPKDQALARVMMHMRTQPRTHIIPHRDAAAQVLGHLRSGGKAAFLVDHNCRRDEAEFLPFLGHIAAVNKGPAILALRAKALVWPVFLLRLKNNGFRLILHEPLDTATMSGTRQERITAICRFYTQAVESMVLRYPEQWFWMHRRWKTQPE